MQEERREDRRLRIIGVVGPGTDGTSGNCTIEDSDIGEPELGECKCVGADGRASGEQDSGERDVTEIGWHGIKVQVLHSAGGAKFKHDPA